MIDVNMITYGTNATPILHGVSLQAPTGKILALLGPSGAGKSTLLRIIAGLNHPDSGTIRLNDLRVNGPATCLAPARRRISLVFQTLALWPHMTVRQHLRFVRPAKRAERRGRADQTIIDLLADTQLTAHAARYPGELSGGQQQRLALARALASEPRFLLLDEPFSNLDDPARQELLALTLALRDKKQMTIIYVTHNIDEALYIADTMVIMLSGRQTACWDHEKVKTLSRDDIFAALSRTPEYLP